MEKVPDTSDQQQSTPPAKASSNESFIFLDTRGKRWPRLKRIMFAVGGLLFIGMILFVQSLFVPSQLTLPPAVEQLKSRLKTALQFKKAQAKQKAARPLWLDFAKRQSN